MKRQWKIDPLIVTSDFLSKNSGQKVIQYCHQRFKTLFQEKKSASFLMQQHVAIIDEVMRVAWKKYLNDSDQILFIAIGGYGRGELHPYSDIDVLILSKEQLTIKQQTSIHQFVQSCWDMGLEISHSVRTITDCLHIAREDLSVFTSLLEATLLEGDENYFQTFITRVLNECWSNQAFYQAKMQELHLRHRKYGDTFNNLEPNIKNGPDGLRDIHTVFWLSKKILSIEKILQQDELNDLLKVQNLLWQIRYALHFFAERKEERLLFDYQKKLANFFGFNEKNNNLAVEKFMKYFFVNVKPMHEILEFVFQFFSEYFEDNSKSVKNNIIYQDELFAISNQNVISILDEDKFHQQPQNTMQLFILIAAREEITKLNSTTIRALKKQQNFNHLNKQFFLQLLKQRGAVDDALIYMNHFDLLGYFIEPFQCIVGLMQYDLFHIHTVDQHSLLVVKQLCQFRKSTSQAQFPLCYQLMSMLEKPYLLFIAAIFHDLGKGHGRDHSEVGAEYAKVFCEQLQLTKDETKLVMWLVQNHLLMSITAQKMDIFDPEVIKNFSKKIGTIERLNYLYLLTVADICSTNPKLWNSWKDTLLQELFRATQFVLTSQKNKTLLLKEKKQHILDQLTVEYPVKIIQQAWKLFDKDYFLREPPSNIVWQTKNLIHLDLNHLPAISIRARTEQGTFEIFIVSQYHVNLFAITTTILSNFCFNIAEANIRMAKGELCLSSYTVLMSEKTETDYDNNFEQLVKALTTHYKNPEQLPHYRQRRTPRELKYFLCPIEVNFSIDKKNERTVMELTSLDRPGLLAQMSRVFVSQNIRLQMAKIMTMGEKVEDIFFITDANHQAIHDEVQQLELKNKILHALQENDIEDL